MKKLVAGLMAFTMVASAAAAPVESGIFFDNSAIEASAADDYITAGGQYRYVFLDDDTVKLTFYVGNGGDVTVPSKIYVKEGEKTVTKTVTEIGETCFDSNDSLTSVVIPEGVKVVCERAFSCCPNLKSVTFPKSITKVNQWFLQCPNVKIKIYPGSIAANYIRDIDPKMPYEYIGSQNFIKSARITGLKDSYVYTGKIIVPNITLKYSTYTLKPGKDYVVSYKDNKNIGSAVLTITGKGIFKGTVYKTFKIVPKKQSITSVSAGKKSVTVKYRKPSYSVTGYQVNICSKSNFKGGKVATLTGKSKTSNTFKNLVSGRKYYVRVRSYKQIGTNTYYGAWSKVKTIRAK